MKTIKVAVGLPWYDGADKDCVGAFLVFQHYLGRLQERLNWGSINPELPPLHPGNPDCEVPEWLIGTRLEFVICDAIGYSLPGVARERVIDLSLAHGADYILFYDADMIFTPDVFLRLLRHKLPVVSALAFTAREPIVPVMYKFTPVAGGTKFQSDPILEYERDALMKVDGVGFGVVMFQASVFRRVPKPWFSSPGVGEDIQFSAFCKNAGIPIHVDTSAKTIHKPRYAPEWHSEEKYLVDQDPEVKAAREALEKLKVERWEKIRGAK